MKCKHCKDPLKYEYGSRGEGCYVKHGCLGEVQEYLNSMTKHARTQDLACAARAFKSGASPSINPYCLLGYAQPVDWYKCSKWFFDTWDKGNYPYEY